MCDHTFAGHLQRINVGVRLKNMVRYRIEILRNAVLAYQECKRFRSRQAVSDRCVKFFLNGIRFLDDLLILVLLKNKVSLVGQQLSKYCDDRKYNYAG